MYSSLSLWLMALMQLRMPFVAASQMPSHSLTARDEIHSVASNERPYRLVVVIICLVYAFVLAFVQGRCILFLLLL
jgi:hypothetical protein